MIVESGPPAPHDGMASYLRCYRGGFDWPPSENLIRLLMEGQKTSPEQVRALIPHLMEKFGLIREQVDMVIPLLESGRSLTRDQAMRQLTSIYQVRCAIEDYIGREIGDEFSIRIFFNRLLEDFGLTVAEAQQSHPGLLSALLTNFQRWKRSRGSDEEQAILNHIAESGKDPKLDQLFDIKSATVFRKALKRFPDPKPEACDSAFDGPQPSTATRDDAEVPPTAVPPPSQPSMAPGGSKGPAQPRLNPGSKALAAAYELSTEGRPVSLKAACERAGVDRKHVAKRYPDEAKIIGKMSRPDRAPRRSTRDRRTGNLDAIDEAADDE